MKDTNSDKSKKPINNWFKQSTLALGIAGLLAASQVVAEPNYDELNKELEILSNLLNTVFKQEQLSDKIKLKDIESQYLSGQGVVMNINTSQRFNGYSVLNFPSGIDVPVPPEPRIFFKSHEYIHGDDSVAPDVEIIIQDSVDEVVRMFERETELLRETQLEARDLARALRSVERETEVLKYELEQADSERKKEIEKQIKKLEEKSKENSSKREKLKEEAESLAKKQKIQREEKLQETKKTKQEFLTAFESIVADNLCRFAGALRSIPNDEHISFVLPNFDTEVSRNNKDRIYVFKMKDVSDCSQNKMKPTKLLSNAEKYDF